MGRLLALVSAVIFFESFCCSEPAPWRAYVAPAGALLVALVVVRGQRDPAGSAIPAVAAR